MKADANNEKNVKPLNFVDFKTNAKRNFYRNTFQMKLGMDSDKTANKFIKSVSTVWKNRS